MALEHDTQVLAKQILEDLKPELVLSSPYSVWDPGKMKFEVAGVTNPQSLAEMQALLVKKACDYHRGRSIWRAAILWSGRDRWKLCILFSGVSKGCGSGSISARGRTCGRQ